MGKIADLAAVAAAVESERRCGKAVVLTNGAFDLLHAGHIRYLRAAKAEGDVLIVAVNSDASVRAQKGQGRPIFPEAERAEIVSAIEGVDWVVIFSEPTVAAVIARVRPDVHAKGTDYSPESVPEGDLVRSYGGRVAIVGDAKDHSTTNVIARMKAKKGSDK